MQVVWAVIECQLIVFAVQRKLTFANTIAPTSNQCRKIGLLATHQLFNATMSLDNICYFTVFVWHHDGTDSTTVVTYCYLVALAVLQDVEIRLLTIHCGLEILTIQTAQIRCFRCVSHI